MYTHVAKNSTSTVWVSTSPIVFLKKTIYQQVLKTGANEASVQGTRVTRYGNLKIDRFVWRLYAARS